MSKNQKQIYISIFIAVIFGVSAILSWQKNYQVSYTPTIKLPLSPRPNATGGQALSEEDNSITQTTGSVIVSAGDIKINLEPNQTFYNALMQAKNSGTIDFSGKNYPGLGFFVTDMGTLHAGSGKYLIYYINGKEATVGVSSYTLKDGDVIEWKLE